MAIAIPQASLTNPVPVRIEEGRVYSASYNGHAILTAHGGKIYKGSTSRGEPIASFSDGKVYAGATSEGEPFACYRNGLVFRGDAMQTPPRPAVSLDTANDAANALAATYYLLHRPAETVLTS